MADRKYCLCCGEDVPFNRVEREGRTELTCAFCGFTLDVEEEPPPARGSTIFLADDSRVTRDLLHGILLSRGIAPDVRSFPDGTAFVSAVSKLFSDHQTLSLAILDLNMPGMDGLTAARTLRALEGQFGLERTPLIFFSSVKCDEDLRRQLVATAPASYVNKGSDSEPDRLVERIDRLISYILMKRKAA